MILLREKAFPNPGRPVVEWAPPQDRGSFYGVVPNVLGGARSYTELWRCGHDRPSLRSGGGGGRESLACVHASWKREDLPMNRQGQTTERVMKIRKITLGLPNANLRHCVSPSDFDVGADVEQGRSSLYS